MILLDANILLYAFDASSPRHDASRGWLERTLSGSEVVGFPLVTILAFIRIGTDPRVFDAPLDTESAIEIVSTWLARPNAQLVEPTARHWQVLAAVSGKGRARGPTVTDAHLS
ncbi:MAG: TA system VapC family ribonuclease toxin, partial [Actinomycetota bacterium]